MNAQRSRASFAQVGATRAVSARANRVATVRILVSELTAALSRVRVHAGMELLLRELRWILHVLAADRLITS